MKKGMTWAELSEATGVGIRMLRKRAKRDGIETGKQIRGFRSGVKSVAIVPASYCNKIINFYSKARRLAAS